MYLFKKKACHYFLQVFDEGPDFISHLYFGKKAEDEQLRIKNSKFETSAKDRKAQFPDIFWFLKLVDSNLFTVSISDFRICQSSDTWYH